MSDEKLHTECVMLGGRALETWVRDVKNGMGDGLGEPKNEAKVMHAHNFVEELQLDEDVAKQLSELAAKGIDVNEFLREEIKLEKS